MAYTIGSSDYSIDNRLNTYIYITREENFFIHIIRCSLLLCPDSYSMHRNRIADLALLQQTAPYHMVCHCSCTMPDCGYCINNNTVPQTFTRSSPPPIAFLKNRASLMPFSLGIWDALFYHFATFSSPVVSMVQNTGSNWLQSIKYINNSIARTS